MSKGILIVVEGPDGVGKTTQVDLLCHRLGQEGVPYIRSREPGGTPLGAKIRELLLHDKDVQIGALAELFLFQADHEQLLAELVEPALARGEVVVLDRYLYSSVAYQMAGRRLQYLVDGTYYHALNMLMHPRIVPDIVFLLMLPRSVTPYTTQPDRIDDGDLFLRDVVKFSYEDMAMRDAARWLVVNAQGERDAIAEEIWREAERHLQRRRREDQRGQAQYAQPR